MTEQEYSRRLKKLAKMMVNKKAYLIRTGSIDVPYYKYEILKWADLSFKYTRFAARRMQIANMIYKMCIRNI